MATRRYAPGTKDPEIWGRWLEEILSEEDCTTDEEDDGIEPMLTDVDEMELDPGTEESSSDEEEMLPEEHSHGITSSEFFRGKDKTTKWRKTKGRQQVRARSHNIIKLFPGTKGDARSAITEIDCLKLFITGTVIKLITSSTNIYIEQLRNRFERSRDARSTNEREISAVIGILFLIGTLRCGRKNLRKIWDNSRGNGLESCYLAMSRNRFQFLLRCLRFDDVKTRGERRELDKLAPIRELFEIFLENFQRNFISSEFLTVDEQLLSFRGRCLFKQFIPSKPAKSGVKVFALVDAKTFYTFNLETYVGTQPDGPYKFENTPEQITLRLVQPVEGTNRNITGDNWFTSLSLVNNLKRKKLTYIGTIRKNRREVPSEFVSQRRAESNSSLFGFKDDCTIVSYCERKKKPVVLLSSMHHDDAIDESTGELKKPVIISDYNRTKIGVDIIDQMIQNYNVARNTKRWPMVIFYDLLNISGINAMCVYKANNPMQIIDRASFIEKFAWELIRPQIEFRATILQLPKEIRRRANLLLGTVSIPRSQPGPSKQYVRRCSICPRTRDKSTRGTCDKCGTYICKQHAKKICTECFSD